MENTVRKPDSGLRAGEDLVYLYTTDTGYINTEHNNLYYIRSTARSTKLTLGKQYD
jgi:hypothetical protein